MNEHYYFGPNIAYAVNPHSVDYFNPAIQVSPLTRRAVGTLHISLFLSAISLDPVPDAEVRLYYGLPNHPATWFYPDHEIGRWPVKLGDSPVYIKDAPVENCVWQVRSVPWKPSSHSRIHNDRFALTAVVICREIHQYPTEVVPAADASVAVHNTLLVP